MPELSPHDRAALAYVTSIVEDLKVSTDKMSGQFYTSQLTDARLSAVRDAAIEQNRVRVDGLSEEYKELRERIDKITREFDVKVTTLQVKSGMLGGVIGAITGALAANLVAALFKR